MKKKPRKQIQIISRRAKLLPRPTSASLLLRKKSRKLRKRRLQLKRVQI